MDEFITLYIIEEKRIYMSDLKLINASRADQEVDDIVNAANDGLWSGGGICEVFIA